jgi:REP element-mobilizing transposase RayT
LPTAGRLIREVCDEREWRIEALTVQPDRVHLFVSCPPRDAPASVMNVIKSITAGELFAAYRINSGAHIGAANSGRMATTSVLLASMVLQLHLPQARSFVALCGPCPNSQASPR